MVKSRQTQQLAPSLWGTFQTQDEAEELGKVKILSTPWLVAEEIKKTNAFGETRTEYQFLTKLFNA